MGTKAIKKIKLKKKHKRAKFYHLAARKKENILSRWKRARNKLLKIVNGLTAILFIYSIFFNYHFSGYDIKTCLY